MSVFVCDTHCMYLLYNFIPLASLYWCVSVPVSTKAWRVQRIDKCTSPIPWPSLTSRPWSNRCLFLSYRRHLVRHSNRRHGARSFPASPLAWGERNRRAATEGKTTTVSVLGQFVAGPRDLYYWPASVSACTVKSYTSSFRFLSSSFFSKPASQVNTLSPSASFAWYSRSCSNSRGPKVVQALERLNS